MEKMRCIKRIVFAAVMLLMAALLQILMFCPLVSVDLPLSKPLDVSFIGTYNLADHLRSIVHGADAVEHGAFWVTVAVGALETAIVMIVADGVRGLHADRRPSVSLGVIGGVIATAVSVVTAYSLYDKVYPFTTINRTIHLRLALWIMPLVALAALVAAVLNRKQNKPE